VCLTGVHDRHADRKTAGRSEGKVTVNGYDKEPTSFARVMGYCEQFDIHSMGLTVAESVRFSAALRLSPDMSPEQVRLDLVHFSYVTTFKTLLDTLLG
jgi:ABC-type multidrug transport system ATPase subunit